MKSINIMQSMREIEWKNDKKGVGGRARQQQKHDVIALTLQFYAYNLSKYTICVDEINWELNMMPMILTDVAWNRLHLCPAVAMGKKMCIRTEHNWISTHLFLMRSFFRLFTSFLRRFSPVNIHLLIAFAIISILFLSLFGKWYYWYEKWSVENKPYKTESKWNEKKHTKRGEELLENGNCCDHF